MNDYIAVRAIIKGIVNSDSTTKGDLGRRFAVHLGLTPGPVGRDGGVDGYGFWRGREIYFQSKLSKNLLDKDEAYIFYCQLDTHQPDIAILLAGIGYNSKFESHLNTRSNIGRFKIHLLKLQDIFEETSIFEAAVEDLPPLRDLGNGIWEEFR